MEKKEKGAGVGRIAFRLQCSSDTYKKRNCYCISFTLETGKSIIPTLATKKKLEKCQINKFPLTNQTTEGTRRTNDQKSADRGLQGEAVAYLWWMLSDTTDTSKESAE